MPADQTRLEKTRRKRPIPDDWATDEEVSTTKPQRRSEPAFAGGRFLSIDHSGALALVGGPDGSAGVYSLSENRVLRTLEARGGSVTGGVWADAKAVISTSAGRVKVFEGEDEAMSFSAHAGEVTAVALHPGSDLIASVGVDKSYVMYDMTTSAVVTQVYTNSGMYSPPFPHLI